MADPRVQIHVLPDLEDLGQGAAQLVAHLSAKAIQERGRFIVAVSGGSLPSILFPHLVQAAAKSDLSKDLQQPRQAGQVQQTIDFSKWFVVFSDERCVPLDHEESNFKLCNELLFRHVNIPANQVITISPEHVRAPLRAAEEYEQRLRELFGWSEENAEDFDDSEVKIDCLLLGMGPDGHTCSLFPGDHKTHEAEGLVAPVPHSPKPPKRRITLTFSAIANSRAALFVTAGASKSEILADILSPKEQEDDEKEQYPAGMVTSEQVHWFLDPPAARVLRQRLIQKKW